MTSDCEKLEKNTKTILIVDDYVPFRKSVAKAFRSLGLNVLEAGDGHEALMIIKYNRSIGLILLDLYMPKMDGLKVAEKLKDRANKGHKKIPVIFLTSEAQRNKVWQGKETGVNAWIIKPPQLETLFDLQKKYCLNN